MLQKFNVVLRKRLQKQLNESFRDYCNQTVSILWMMLFTEANHSSSQYLTWHTVIELKKDYVYVLLRKTFGTI